MALLQRLVLAADRGPARRLLRLVYEWITRAYVAFVCFGEPDVAVYVRGTLANREAIPGLSDIDLIFVLATGPDDAMRTRVLGRCARAARAVPASLVDPWPVVYDQATLASLANSSVFTYGLADGRGGYADSDRHVRRLLERPELYGTASWRRVSGPERRPAENFTEDAMRRINSWLELQNWWRWAFDACLDPDRPRIAYVCVKMMAESARIWLWLARGEQVVTRSQALARGRAELSAEADAFERAQRLFAHLRQMPDAPLAEYLPPFIRISRHIAEELAGQTVPMGTTEVRLFGGVEATQRTPERLLPLADWRAIAASAAPDELFELSGDDPADPRVVADAAAVDSGPYRTLCHPGLMLRPARWGERSALRAVQCPVTDPVSFALAHGSRLAPFPNVPGWSIQHTARRAAAEHAAWLTANASARPEDTIGRLLAAARAGLLEWSIARGEPELALTGAAVLDRLASAVPSAEPIATAVRAARDNGHPPASAAPALRDAILALPAYAAIR